LCAGLEKQAKNGHAERAGATLAEVSAEFARVCEQLRKELST
jgi:hypothetical protein